MSYLDLPKLCSIIWLISLLVANIKSEDSNRPPSNQTSSDNFNQSAMFGNMSTMMQLSQAQRPVGTTLMTNASLTKDPNVSASPLSSSSRLSASSTSQATAIKMAQNAGAKVTNGQARTSQHGTSSPAINSRAKSIPNLPSSVATNKKANEAVMSADDTRDNQSFVTINSGTTTILGADQQNAGIRNTPKLIHNQQSSSISQTTKSSDINNQQRAPHVGKAPIVSSGSTWPPISSSKAAQWRARTGTQLTAVPKFITNAGYTQQQQYLSSQEQIHEPNLNSNDPSQLEKPNGYSYGETSELYTHTSVMSPARHEIQSSSSNHRAKSNSQPFLVPILQDHRMAHSIPQFDIARPQQQMITSSGAIQFEQQPLFNDVQRESRLNTPTSVVTSPAQQHPQSPSQTQSFPCKPPGIHQDLVQSNIQVSGEPKYLRAGDGTRLRSNFVFKVIRADSLTDCELACTRASSLAGNNQQDTCRAFNYRPYFAAENCELSRHDFRSLKLNDPAQFEQHTQFDFYVLDWASVGSASTSPASASLHAYSPFAEQDCVDVSQSCSQDGMEFTLRTNEPFNGRIYTYGFYDSCYLDGDGGTNNVLRITRSNGFPRCGTQQIGDLMTNIVVVQYNDFVQTTRDKKYNLTCYFSGPGEAVVTSNYLDTKVDERSHPIQIEHLPPQNVITSNVHIRVLYRGQPTNTIAVGDLLTFRLESKSTGSQRLRASSAQDQAGSTQTEIFATNVIAKDPYSGRQVLLIDGRGCPVDPVNVFPELQRTPDGALESEFYAFKIPDSNFLIFQATVRTCRAPCEPVICQTTSHSNTDAPNRNQYQLLPTASLTSGVKGGALVSSIPSHSLSSPGGSVSAPSWGRRRRRRRDIEDSESDQDGGLSLGESIEHVIPAKMVASNELESIHDGQKTAQTAQTLTFRRPELSDAEEEVKEMFRVFMSRAEMNRKIGSERQSQDETQPHKERIRASRAKNPEDNSSAGDEENIIESSNICISWSGYYIMLFTVIALSLVMLSMVSILWFVTRRTKFCVSDPIANSMY